MNQNEFARLTRTCDLILKRCAKNHAIVGISWLHVLNVHPNSIQHYQYALQPRSFFSAAKFTFYNIAYIGYKFFTSLFEERTHIQSSSQADVLFISHLVGTEIPKGNSDFYYGELPFHAETKKGLVPVVGLIDHTPKRKTRSQLSVLEKNKPAKYLFSKTKTFHTELKLAGQCFSSFRTLMRLSKEEEDPGTKTVLREAALQSLAPETFYTLRIYESIDALLKHTKPASLVITWEGRAWERLALFAARKIFGHAIKCIGYQHTILLSSSHSIKRSLGDMYDPDLIFTLGEITAHILKTGLIHTSFQSYGSYRLVLSGEDHFRKLDRIVCLVTPEGLDGESLLLFGLAVETAKKMPHVNFIFRMHPVFPFSMFTKNHPEFLDLPSNCIVSDLPSVNDDLKRCNFLLYRASSVALYAVMSGLKPVYYNVKDEMPIDSLFLLGNWRSCVQNCNEFSAVINTYGKMPDAEKEEQYLSALSICRQYVSVPDETVFLNSLSSKN